MKGAVSKALIVVGIIFVVAAILWWAIAVPALVKFPKDVESHPVYEGDVTIYMNPLTGEIMDQPIESPLTINRDYESIDEEYDSGKAVVQETITQHVTVFGASQKIIEPSQYVLDRETIENVDDPRSWAYEESNQVNRSGTWYLSFPFDINKDETYKVFENKVNTFYEITSVTDNDEEDIDGLKVYNFAGELKPTQVTDFYVQYSDYPESITFDELKAKLAAAGLDVDALLALLAPVLSPEDAATIAQVSAQPIALKYEYANTGGVSLEPKTGSVINLTGVVETITVSPDLTGFTGKLQPLLAKYKDASPELNAAISKVEAAMTAIMQMEPQKVYEASYSQTDESIKEAVEDAKDSIGMINWVKVYVPWILLILGAAVLVGGLLMGGSPVPLEEEEEPAAEAPEE